MTSEGACQYYDEARHLCIRAAPSNNPRNPCAEGKAVASGLFNLGIGVLKIGVGIAAGPETGGLSLYAAYSGLSNVVSGGAQFYGAISGRYATGDKISNYASAIGSVSGAATLAITGNAQYGANASAVESLATVGLTGGFASTGTMAAPRLADNAISAADNAMGVGGFLGFSVCHN